MCNKARTSFSSLVWVLACLSLSIYTPFAFATFQNDFQKELVILANKEDFPGAESLYRKRQFNVQDYLWDESTPFVHYAVQEKNIHLMRVLIHLDFPMTGPHAKNKDHQLPLTVAANQGQIEMTQSIIYGFHSQKMTFYQILDLIDFLNSSKALTVQGIQTIQELFPSIQFDLQPTTQEERNDLASPETPMYPSNSQLPATPLASNFKTSTDFSYHTASYDLSEVNHFSDDTKNYPEVIKLLGAISIGKTEILNKTIIECLEVPGFLEELTDKYIEVVAKIIKSNFVEATEIILKKFLTHQNTKGLKYNRDSLNDLLLKAKKNHFPASTLRLLIQLGASPDGSNK